MYSSYVCVDCIDVDTDDTLSLAAHHALVGLHERSLLPVWSVSDPSNELPSPTTASGVMQKTSPSATVHEVIDDSFVSHAASLYLQAVR